MICEGARNIGMVTLPAPSFPVRISNTPAIETRAFRSVLELRVREGILPARTAGDLGTPFA